MLWAFSCLSGHSSPFYFFVLLLLQSMHAGAYTLRLPVTRVLLPLQQQQVLQQQQQLRSFVLQLPRPPKPLSSRTFSCCSAADTPTAAAAAARRLISDRCNNTMKREEGSSSSPAAATEQQQQLSPEEQQLKAEREARKKQKEAEKAAKEAAKAAKKKAQEEEQRAAALLLLRESAEYEADSFGYWPLIQSKKETNNKKRHWTNVADVDKHVGEKVWVRARLQDARCKGSLAFITLREGLETLQCVFGPSTSRDLLKWLAAVPSESLIDVLGSVVSPESPVTSTTRQSELQGEKVFCIVKAPKELPFQLKDAAMPEDEQEREGVIRVHLDTRLDNRCLDLRVPATLATQKAVSFVSSFFRDYLLHHNFTEIHTPKIIPGASEGGASCFKVPYFNREACLAQSPQLYKQMCIAGDMKRVFEIGPVFRAENSNTHRHLCEFVGIDLEMEIKEDFMEAVDVIDDLFKHIFKHLETTANKESALIRQQFSSPPFVFLDKTPRLTFSEGVQMLRDAGIGSDTIPADLGEFDLSTEHEKALGKLVKDKYNTDYYILLKYPAKVRPFYSMPDPEDPKFSNTFDIFMRGEEIASGAQRIHNAALLRARCEAVGIPQDQLKAYIDAMELGAPPHAGMGAGLERVVMLYYGLGNIRRVSLFPRDPKRLSP